MSSRDQDLDVQLSEAKHVEEDKVANERCPNHGGLSSGPKTAEGRERIAEAQRARWTRWRSKRVLKGLK